MELRQNNNPKIRLKNSITLFLLICLTDFCQQRKLTDAIPDSRTAGSRESKELLSKRPLISEDEESGWLRRVQRSISDPLATPVLLRQQEQRRLHSLPKFFPANSHSGYGSNLGTVSTFYSAVENTPPGQLSSLTASASKTGSSYGGSSYFMEGGGNIPEMQVWPGAGYGTAQMPQESSYPGTSSGYGALPNSGIGGPTSPYAGYLEKQINSYPIMLYTLNDCIPCQRAKHLLALSYPDVHAHFLELSGNEPWQQQLQVDLQYLTGAITFPYIFVCGQYIGGASDLFEWHETGQLRRTVSQCLKPIPK